MLREEIERLETELHQSQMNEGHYITIIQQALEFIKSNCYPFGSDDYRKMEWFQVADLKKILEAGLI